MMSNYLFIGGAGFIGSSIIKSLLSLSPDSCVLILEPESANVSRLDGLNVHIVRGRLDDFELVASLISDYKVDTLVHLVSTLLPSSGFDDYQAELAGNVLPTIKLVNHCAMSGVRFVFFSSGGTVYGNTSGGLICEETPLDPISYYGLSKKLIESEIQFEAKMNKLKFLILRPSNPFGPGQNVNGNQGLVAVCLGKLLSGDELTIWGSGNAVRDYIFIDDLASAVSNLLESGATGHILNVGSGIGLSVNDVIAHVNMLSDHRLNVKRTGSRDSDVSSVVLDIRRLQALSRFRITPFHEGLAKFHRFLIAQNEK